VVPPGASFDNELVRLFDLSLDAFCVAGFDGYLKLVNPAFARMLGYPREQLLARPFMEIIHPDDRESVRTVLVQVAAGHDVVGFQCRQLRADGSVRWFEWNTRTRPEEGVVYGVARDVTDRRVANDELSALRRVATLVAEGVQPQDLFAVVAEEVARVGEVPLVRVMRYELDGTATVCASFPTRGHVFAVGTRWSLDGTSVLQLVRTGAEPARIDDYSQLEGAIADAVRRSGIRSTVGIPIVVAGRLWGAMVVSSGEPDPLPEGTEARLAGFTELLATAVANAESHEALARLAEEQAALRRVATLVAQGVPPVEIFAAVSDEVGGLIGAGAAVLRFEHDRPAIVFVGVSTNVEIPIGTRWEFQAGMASAEVYRTGRSARVDAVDWSSASGPVAAAARRVGVVSTVVSPITVEGRLWGAMSVSSPDDVLPVDTEVRLEKFTELLATAVANAESRSELAASRRRIVAASDEARRRIERDLHDGTQQRLVSLGLAVRATEARVPLVSGDLRAELSGIAAGLADAVAELQELSRGIHPAILSEGGLGPALRTLARRCAVPVELDIATSARFPEPIEVAAYYVASEALANVMKHAQASRIELSLATRNGSLRVSIRDDGVGGADRAGGSGLVGLADRVEALGGSIDVRSGVGDGTSIIAQLPLNG
jgi:PAS domain S-box-containing protein